MNTIKAIVALAALITGGQIMAWTLVKNETDQPIQFRAALYGGDINKDWQEPAIPPFESRKFGGGMLLRYRYDVRAQDENGQWLPVDFSHSGGDNKGSIPANNEAGNRVITIFKKNGFWHLRSKMA